MQDLLLGESLEAVAFDSENNLLIHGDNLPALKALERDYTGKVKCVYIDPPYNTKGCLTHYDDSMEHSMWLDMMKERLAILRRLLREDGSIWISIDDRECHYLKVLCDEIFGRKNFVSCIAVKMSTASGVKTTHKEKTIIKEKEYILCFAKNKSQITLNPQYIPKLEWNDEFRYFVQNRHSDPEQWEISNLTDVLKLKNIPFDPSDKRFVDFTIKNSNKIWRRAFVRNDFKKKSQERRNKVLSDKKGVNFYYNGRQIYFYKNQFHSCFTENGLEDLPSHLLGDFWSDINTSKLFNEGGVDFRNGKKPEFLISRIINLSTNPGDIVLDCFAGSGTTGAVAHKMKRRWIMVEMNDHCETLIVPRLQKVIDGTGQGGITEAVGWKGGGGFRFFKMENERLQESLM